MTATEVETSEAFYPNYAAYLRPLFQGPMPRRAYDQMLAPGGSLVGGDVQKVIDKLIMLREMTAAGIVNLSVRWAEGRRFLSEVRSGRSACLGDLAPNPKGALARSSAALGGDGFGIGNVEEIRYLIVNR